MKRRILVFAFVGVLSGIRIVSAESVNERDFKQARSERDKSAVVALDPINRRYRETLEKLFKKATQAAELDLAKQIQAELQTYGGASAAKSVAEGQPARSSPTSAADRADLRKLIENSEWNVFVKPSAVNKGEPDGRIVFHRDGSLSGSGTASNLRGYMIEAPDILRIYHGASPKKNPKAAKSNHYVLRVNIGEKTAQRDDSLSTQSGNMALKYDGPAKLAK